ncbi:MAG: exosortase/archaeosortase family protein [Candidatus Bathyarchaeia archaeon]
MKRLLGKLEGIPSILRENWQHILAASLILLLVAVVYWRDLKILADEAIRAEALSHVLLIPLFVGLLLYWKRDLFKASVAMDSLHKKSKNKFLDELVGLSLCLIAFLIYWYSSYTFYPLEYHMLSLPIFVSGLMLVLFNMKTLKMLAVPVLLLAFLVPIPSDMAYILGGNLANFNTQASYTILKCFGLPVTLNATYGSPTIALVKSSEQHAEFTVGLPCSGIYMLTAFFMFAVFLAAMMQTSLAKKVLVFMLGFVVFEILNIVRITSIIVAAYIFGEEIAMLIFHAAAGLILTFIGIFTTLIISEKLLKVKVVAGKNEAVSCLECEKLQKRYSFCLNCGRLFNQLKIKPSKIFWAKMVLLLSGCLILSLSVNTPVFAVSKETLEVASWDNTANILPQIPGYSLVFSYPDVDYARIAKQDASLVYGYSSINLSIPVIYVLVGVADSISNLHNWEVCLITWQTVHGHYPLVSVIDSKDITLLEDVPLIARYLVFKAPENYTQVTLYWFERATFRSGGTVQQKYVRISLVIITESSANYQKCENLLLDFGRTIADYWQPLKSQSLISLGIPAQQILLILSLTFIITSKTTQYTNDWRKRTNNLKIFNNFASSEDELVLQAVSELSKEKGAATTKEINLLIKSKAGRFMKFEILVDRLNHLQEYGFIKLDLTSNNNKPILVWKSLVNI